MYNLVRHLSLFILLLFFRTDMLIHAVDPKTNKIVDADDLLKLVLSVLKPNICDDRIMLSMQEKSIVSMSKYTILKILLMYNEIIFCVCGRLSLVPQL